MIVRRADLGDEAIVRALRLQALADAPQAFDSTLVEERSWAREAWSRWILERAVFLVEHARGARGLAAGVPHAGDPAAVFLASVWVHPEMRGTGAGDALVEAVLSWAEHAGAAEIHLHVGRENLRAQRLYERAGFRATGEEIVRVLDGLVEIEMRRPVGRPSAWHAAGSPGA